MKPQDYEMLISCGFRWQSLDVLFKDFFERTELVDIKFSHMTLIPNVFIYKFKDSNQCEIIRRKKPDRSMY